MIKEAAMSDRDVIRALVEELEECSFPEERFECILEGILQNPDHVVLLYEKENEICAVLHMRMEYQLHHCARIAEVLELDVKDSRRNEGIGRQMFQEACVRAKEAGCVQIELVSNRRRHDAHRFYEEKGMVRSHYGFTMPL
ncbi:MAG: GNAT family N-acetyltransferase [Solobacterium sp.]|nr:GNAT family N-acetyltransferase [Solobacterium sp.]